MLIVDEVHQTIGQILDGFCENHTDLFPAVALLRSCYEQLPADSQAEFFKILAGRLQSEPISFPSSRSVKRSAHILIIRAWAAFGPADALPDLLFSMLRQDSQGAMESWASMIGTELVISVSSYSTRFSEAALAAIKGHCASISCDQAIGLTDSRVPPPLVEVLERLENLVKKIAFDKNVVQKLWPELSATRPAAPRRGATRKVVVKSVVKQSPRDAILWRDLYDRFKLLADEQRVVPEELRLRMFCDYTDHSSEFVFYFKPEFGKWTRSKGPDHVFWEKFEAVATLAGDKLGPPKNTASPPTWGAFMGNVSGSVYWLHELYEYLLKNASPEVSAADDKRGVIRNVCQASAAFCAHLAKEEAGGESTAEVSAERAKHKTVAPNSQPETTKRLSRGGRPRKDDERRKVAALRSQGKTWAQVAIQMNRETDQSKSKDAYRNLFRSGKP